MPRQTQSNQLWACALNLMSASLQIPLMESSRGAVPSLQVIKIDTETGSETSGDTLIAAGISALIVMAARMLAENAGSVAANLPEDAQFPTQLTMLLFDSVEEHCGHELGGILVMQLACLLQSFPKESRSKFALGEPKMRCAVSEGDNCSHCMLLQIATGHL